PRARDPRARRGAARREPSRLVRAGEGGPGPGAPRRRGIRRARARPGARRAGHRAPARDRPAGALLGRHRARPRRGDREDGSRPGVKRVAYRLFRSTASFQYRLGRQLTPAGKLVLVALSAAGLIERRRGAGIAPRPLPPLPEGGAREVEVALLPLRRGRLAFTGVTIARPDLFGLVNALVTIPLPGALVVLPKRYAVPDLALPG